MTYDGGDGAGKVKMTAIQVSLDRGPWGQGLVGLSTEKLFPDPELIMGLLSATLYIHVVDQRYSISCPLSLTQQNQDSH